MGRGADPPDIDSPEYWRDAWNELASRGKGFVVWESNRTGPFRIWHRNLDGSDLRQLSPDEQGRSHYCPHISPNGKKLVYVSFPENRWQDGWAPTPQGQKRPMHLINIDGTGDRVIVENVRTYEEHRAAVWLNEEEIIYIDGHGVTQQLDVTTGAQVALTREGQEKFGWLINPTKTFATGRSIWITFSPYDPITRTVTPAHIYGGCQPYFSRDGVWGFYMGGKGGPINRVHLATGKLSWILAHKDPRLPKRRSHAYCPMLSPNQRLFTFAVAPKPTSERDPNSDYDIFVARCNPNTLEIIGKPARYTFKSCQDRFPDAFLEEARVADLPDKGGKPGPWPTNQDGLVFRWENAKSANLAEDPATGKRRYYRPMLIGQVWLDHNYALHTVGRGAFLAEEAGPIVVAACRKSNALSIEVSLRPATTRQGSGSGRNMRPARILTLGPAKDGRKANAALGQVSHKLFLQLDTDAPKDAARKGPLWTDLNCRVGIDEPTHLVITYEPGKLVTYVNGKKTMDTDAIQGDLGGWTAGGLLLAGLQSTAEAWSGTLEGIALYSRALEHDEVKANHDSYLAILAARKAVPKFKIRAKLLARANIPVPKDLGVHRICLVVYEYETERRDNSPAPARFRVAHWGILDRQYVGLDKKKEGEVYKLILENFSDNPQLEIFPLWLDPLGEDLDIPFYFDTGR